MSPNIDEYSAGICVDCAEQGAQRVVKTDHKNGRADRLQVLRHKTHPKFFARMAELAIRHVEHDSVIDFCPFSVVRQENKLRVSVDEFLDKPWAGDSIHFNFLAGDPFHKLDLVSWQLGFGMRSLLLCFTARIKSLPSSRRIASAKAWADSLSRRRPHCRSCFTLHFFGLAEAGIRNSAQLGSIIRCSPESASERARSRFFSFSSAVVRCPLFRLF